MDDVLWQVNIIIYVTFVVFTHRSVRHHQVVLRMIHPTPNIASMHTGMCGSKYTRFACVLPDWCRFCVPEAHAVCLAPHHLLGNTCYSTQTDCRLRRRTWAFGDARHTRIGRGSVGRKILQTVLVATPKWVIYPVFIPVPLQYEQ